MPSGTIQESVERHEVGKKRRQDCREEQDASVLNASDRRPLVDEVREVTRSAIT